MVYKKVGGYSYGYSVWYIKRFLYLYVYHIYEDVRGDVVTEMDRLGRIWKRRQEKLFNTFERVEALKFLKDIGIITQRDYWILNGNYKIVDC